MNKSNILWKSLIVSPAVLGSSLLMSTTAMANSNHVPIPHYPENITPESLNSNGAEINGYTNVAPENTSPAQVTSVTEFSDIQSTHWAYHALHSLAQRYGCVSGYPDGTFRGRRALSRYEFAAALNACLDRVNELIATVTVDMVTKEDLAIVYRLQEEFSAELATLRSRVNSLEGRTTELERHQFSTTTKLNGEAVFAITDTLGDQVGDNNKTAFQNRVRLGLQTSFTGRDILTTRLAAGNAQNLNLGNDRRVGPALAQSGEGVQTFNIGNTGNNNVTIDRLTYQAPLGRGQVYLAASGGQHSHYAATNNPYFSDGTDGGNGGLSTLTAESPIYRIGGGAGVALRMPVGANRSSFTIGYLASEASSSNPGEGAFKGNYAALGQFNFPVGDRISIATTYVHGYHGAGSAIFDGGNNGNLLKPSSGRPIVGTTTANYGGVDNTTLQTNPFETDSYGVSASFRPSDKISINGFVSYTDVQGIGNSRNDDSEVWSYGVGVALPDVGKRGNVLGIFAGAQPYALGREIGADKVPYQIEGFYKYRVSDQISVTPGVIWISNSGQKANSDDVVIGTLRTTFSF